MDSYFQKFSSSVKNIKLPEKFTFPFYYEPHPLCKLAANEVQNYLLDQKDFNHNFGLKPNKKGLVLGKMFGILIVLDNKGEIGYLTAVSGKMAGKNLHKIFVPPVYDMLKKDSPFLNEEKILNKINTNIEKLEKDSTYVALKVKLASEKTKASIDISKHKEHRKKTRKKRKIKRLKAVSELSGKSLQILQEKLNNDSIKEKQLINNVRRYWNYQIDSITDELSFFSNQIFNLKKLRKTKSANLQQYLFEQYQFLNSKKETKNLIQLFSEKNDQNIPAGAGECAAPKLLQYAFLNDLEPLAMAEFWWGKSPNKEIRKHQQFYPSCQGKCKPILKHMLSGIEMDKNPMLQNPAIGKELEIVFEDNELIVINKPADFLSVPGVHIHDSVFTRIKQLIKNISGPIIIHRLDMATSGLLVLAKNKRAHKEIQSQFIKKTVKKRYTALIAGNLIKNKGFINLPLRVDLNDRPRQLVCYEFGKKATTHWEVIKRSKGSTKIYFYPISGRTHQLRVHAAHTLGLNSPIIGDDLYGNKSKRLYLHADSLEFKHPLTHKIMKFNRAADF